MLQIKDSLESMEKNDYRDGRFFDFKNHQNWSKKHFAWFYAVLILVGTVLYGYLLRKAGVYESAFLRLLNIFIILIGFIALMWDYRGAKKHKLSYVNAFLLCARTGFYFLLLFLPLLLLFLANDQKALELVRDKETFGSQLSVLEITFWLYVEIVCTTLMGGLLAAFIARFSGKDYD